MNLRSMLDSLKSRKFRFGGYATLMVIVVLAVLVAVNLLVDQIPGKLDLTQNQIFSLSPETYKVVSGLTNDVTITMLAKPGSEDPTIKAILDKYAAASRHIKVQSIDLELNPTWAKQYETPGTSLSAGGVVVAGARKFRTVGLYDMYNYDTSNPNQQPQLTSLSVEQRVTSALLYIGAARNVTLATLQGQGEETLDSVGLASAASNDNYTVTNLDLLSAKAVPPDTDILLILAPNTDLSAEAADKVRSFLAAGGRAVIVLDLLKATGDMPNLAGILKTYGLQVQRGLIVESDQNKVAGSNPLWILPNLEYHDILTPIRNNNYPILMPNAEAIQTLALHKATLKIEPLLTTSASSYDKPSPEKAKTSAKEPGDIAGPFNLAVAVTDPANQGGNTASKDTKLVVIGSAGFLNSQITSQVPGNSDFFMNSVGWLTEKPDTITVRAKSLLTMRLTMSQEQSLLYAGIVVILMPLLVLGGGFYVWIRRRHL